LERAFQSSLFLQPSSAQFILHAIDVSGSMGWTHPRSTLLSCSEIAAIVSLSSLKTNPNTTIGIFSDSFQTLPVGPYDSFATVFERIQDERFGVADEAAVWKWLLAVNVYVDVVCFWTDYEWWMRSARAVQMLSEYRRQVNPRVKAIYVTLSPKEVLPLSHIDSHSFDIIGYDARMQSLLALIMRDGV
jgi:60 kDa SS-A/Ro ribonucleoprotein